MSSNEKIYLAIDLGAESGRAVLGRVCEGRVEIGGPRAQGDAGDVRQRSEVDRQRHGRGGAVREVERYAVVVRVVSEIGWSDPCQAGEICDEALERLVCRLADFVEYRGRVVHLLAEVALG